jgi:hypothetical protein
MDEASDDQKLRLVEVLLKCSMVIKKISAALAIMVEKRATLEEKMIKSYFIRLASVQGQVSERIVTALAAKEGAVGRTILSDLDTVADKILSSVDDFLKAARYDLNYLEQYFEHQFYSELETSKLLEDSLKLFASLSASIDQMDQNSPSQAETE